MKAHETHFGTFHEELGGESICTALECFFQSNAYHPQATCDQCGHLGSIPISLRTDSVSTVQSIPAETSVDPRREAEREHSVILDTSSEAELVEQPCTGVQTPVEVDYAQVTSMAHQSSSSGGSDMGGKKRNPHRAMVRGTGT